MDKKLGIKLAVTLVLVFSGCATSKVVPLDNGVYYVFKGEPILGGGPPTASMVSSVYNEARQFCAKQGLVTKSVSKRYQDSSYGKLATFSLEFKCVKK